MMSALTHERFLAAVVQMNSGEDKTANLAAATRLVEQAAAQGAGLVVLPEMFPCLGRPPAILAAGEPIPGPTSEAMRGLAARHKILLVAGSLPESGAPDGRVYNTCLVFSPAGELLAKYRKLHRFDVDLPDVPNQRESAWCAAGDERVCVDTPLGKLGIAICYDLRFPELFRALALDGAELIVVPSAFTAQTGKDHWQVLVRARAIESQAYVLAANQFGTHAANMTSYGRSCIVDPWGVVVATASDGAGVAIAEVDRARVAQVRARMPVLAHARLRIE